MCYFKVSKKHNFSLNRKTVNESFFDVIDTEAKAYWLGFLYADGNVSTNSYHISCDLHIDDIEHLEKLYSALNIFRLPRTDNKLQRCRFAISCKHIKDALIEKGCVPNKSYILKFPDENIFKSKDLIRHFIRGYFDGDGCLSYGGSKNIFKPRCCIVGTKNILQNIEVYSNTSWTWYVANKTSDLIFDIKSNINNSIKFLQWIYENSTIYLNRKYYRYLCFKNHNFAVSKSDFRDNDRVISEKAKLYVQNNYPNFVYKHVNTEIIK